MYLHVGNHRTICLKSVIGLFDADSATVSAVTKKYLTAAQADKSVEFASEELPKSFILYQDRNGKRRICFSQLSTASLSGRAEAEY